MVLAISHTSLSLVLVSSWAYSLFRYFRRLGVFGLILLGALDSSFLVLPFGNDLLLIALVSSNRSALMAIAYVLASVAGSLLGAFVIDSLMRKTGEKGLDRLVSKRKRERLKRHLENRGWLTVFVGTVLPPPFPFTAVLMTASALQTSRQKVLSAVALGRLLRFSTEAILALYFGRQVIHFLRSPVVEYGVYALILVALVLSVLSIKKWVS